MSPRLREAMVGWGPNEGSLSLCQPILSLPSRYRLHSNELNVWPLFCSTARRRVVRTGCHYNKREIWKKDVLIYALIDVLFVCSLANVKTWDHTIYLSIGLHSGAWICIRQLSIPTSESGFLIGITWNAKHIEYEVCSAICTFSTA